MAAPLPPLRVQPQLVPDVLVVDIGIAQKLLNMPDQISRLLIGKAKGHARAARKRRRRPASPGRTRCGNRSRTPDRQLSSQPDRLRPAVVLCRALHRQFGDRARLRAAPADAAHAARLRRVGADAQHRAGVRTGVAGADRGAGRPRLRLFHRRRIAARRRGLAARSLWRADPGRADAEAGMVDRGPRHQRCRRADRGRDQPDQSASGCRCWRPRSRRPGGRRSSAG